jgi:hypothetical protein
MTVSSSVDPLLHLFLCLVLESSSTDQGEALDALLLSLQGQQRSLERAVELDQTVATMVMDYDPRGAPTAESHNRAIRRGSLIAYMCDRMFVRLEVQACKSLTRFLVKSHDRATTVMGCMNIHTRTCISYARLEQKYVVLF